MYILGIAPYHESAACILKDGRLIAAAQEERFQRKKHYSGFPKKAIDYVLKEARITLDGVDYVAFPNQHPTKQFSLFFKNYVLGGTFLLDDFARWGWRPFSLIKDSVVDRWGAGFFREIGGDFRNNQIIYIDHHTAHAASAFRCSPFKKSLIMTMDGWGDWTSTLLALGEGNEINVVKRIKSVNSLGFFYSSLTKFLGYPHGDGHEQKIMGLAPLGKPIVDFSKIISYNGYFYKINPRYVYGKNRMKSVESLFGPSLKNVTGKIPENYKNVAATLQNELEKAGLKLLQYMVDNFDYKNLCLAGGVAMNCKMNGELLKSGLVDNIYVQPAAIDSGNAVGAALEAYARLGHKSKFEMKHAYWGPGYSDEEIEAVLRKNKIKYEKHGDIAGVCAELIAKKKVVCWFQNRMEWGARALGARSILLDPREERMRDVANFVKGREWWRPSAPSILAEAVEEYFENACDSPFMILAFYTKEEKRREIPAVVHFDGTSRPQTVEKKINPLYWRLIKEFEKLTGVPVVLNTSFNRNEPIVCTPEEAVRTFFGTASDYLAIGNFLVKKQTS